MPRSALLASIAVSALIAGCAHAAKAEAEPPPPAEHTDVAPRAPMMTGGFSTAEIKGADIEKARDLAIAAIYKQFPTSATVEAVTAERQVVAGLNYRFHVTMSGDPGASYVAVVYQNLQRVMSVSSVKAVE